MKRKRPLYRIYLLLIAVFFSITGIILLVVNSNSNNMIAELTASRAQTANNALVNYLSDLREKARERAIIMAGSDNVKEAIGARDYDTLSRVLKELSEGIDFASICDDTGVVMARTYTDKRGDSLSGYKAVSYTLETGVTSSTIEDIANVGLSVYASAAVYDGDRLIGVVNCNVDLTDAQYLDVFKRQNGCEATIFYGDTRVNTTIDDMDDDRIVGTKADARVADTVLNGGSDYTGRIDAFGRVYQGYYSPIFVGEEAIGMLFTGVDIVSTLDYQRNMQNLIILIAVIAIGATGIFLAAVSRFTKMFNSTLNELSDKTETLNILVNVLDGMNVFLYVTDAQTDEILFVNKALLEHLGKTGNIIGLHCWKVFQKGMDGRCGYCSLGKLLEKPEEVVEWEGVNTITGRYYKSIDRLLDWPDGKKVHFCQRIDMTETMKSLERAEQASRAKSDFLSRMSHEMRTPMNAILGMTALAQKEECGDEARARLNAVTLSAEHLLGIINNILDMSKIEEGTLELAKTEVSVRALADQAAAVMALDMGEKEQRLTVEIDEDVPQAVLVDGQRLAGVITSLLGNAHKFTPEGGHIALRVHKTQEDGQDITLLFEVEDDGIGISEQQQERLFDAFEQADNTINRQYGGAGLGLAIAKSVVTMMNGEIWVKSQPGQGSLFSFTIRTGSVAPANNDEADAAVPNAGNEDNLFAGKRILLADDVEINRMILMALLEDTGVDIDCAENGREVCAMFAANPGGYDLIFMDIHMPEMNGYEATQAIRTMDAPEGRAVPIIAMTADVFSQDIEKCLAAGMNGHVGKPLDMEDVIASMKRHMLRESSGVAMSAGG